MQYAPTRAHAKPVRFHISAHGCAKNAPDFILSNKDTPKPRPVLDPNRRRRTFRGVCFCAPTRVRTKFDGFHISPPEYVKNAPDFTLPNRDTPKTRPILGANLRRGTFRGVCFCALHGYVQNSTGFRPKSSSRIISGRMLLRPTRVRAKPARFHISTHVPTKNPPDFTHPNKDIPKTGPILDLNLRRGFFRGVCNTPLHGYVQNLSGFHIPAHDISRNPAGFIFPHTTWRKTRRVLVFATRHSAKLGGFLTLPHDMAQNPAGFGLCHTT